MDRRDALAVVTVGVLLTVVSVQAVPAGVDLVGWHCVFSVIALGPLVGKSPPAA